MQQFHVGFARVDITPDEPVALSGDGDDTVRIFERVLDPVTGTCIALTDEAGETALIYSVDLLYVSDALRKEVCNCVSAATGILPHRIHLSGTHTHSAPSLSTMQLDATKRFFDRTVKLLTQAAISALEDRAPAKLFAGSCQTENMNFVRHYRMENGSYGGDNFGTWDSPITGHASPADEQIQLVRFVREAKPDILLVNWQAHAKMSSTATTAFGKEHRKDISSDFIGFARQALEEMTGTQVIYFSGASGNLNPSSRMETEPTPEDPAVYGALLAQAVKAGLGDLKPLDAGAVSSNTKTITIPIDHSDDHKLALAQQIWAIWSQDQQLCKDTARAAGFNSAYAARDVIGRHQAGTERKMELNTITAGALAFVAAPYEMFCVNGQQIKEASPYQMTIIMTCANGYLNYLPSDFAFSHGGYEVDSRKFPRGTAEKVVDTFLEMLKG